MPCLLRYACFLVRFVHDCSRLVWCFLKTRNVHRGNNSSGDDVGNDECADDDYDDGCPYGTHLFPPAIFKTQILGCLKDVPSKYGNR